MRRYNAGDPIPVKGDVVIVGGGFTAVDCSRAARRMLGEAGRGRQAQSGGGHGEPAASEPEGDGPECGPGHGRIPRIGSFPVCFRHRLLGAPAEVPSGPATGRRPRGSANENM